MHLLKVYNKIFFILSYSKLYNANIVNSGASRVVDFVLNSTSFKSVNTRFSGNPAPQCKEFPYMSSSYWECYTRYFTFTLYHPVRIQQNNGTCASICLNIKRCILFDLSRQVLVRWARKKTRHQLSIQN